MAGLNGIVHHGEGIATEWEGAQFISKQWQLLRQQMGLFNDIHEDL